MTIAQQLNVKEFPFIIHDNHGNVIYHEDASGFWFKREFDSNDKEIYYENSNGKIIDATAPRLLTEDEVKRVSFTHVYHYGKGWIDSKKPVVSVNIYHVGKCLADGDMFIKRDGEFIRIYKGKLNAL